MAPQHWRRRATFVGTPGPVAFFAASASASASAPASSSSGIRTAVAESSAGGGGGAASTGGGSFFGHATSSGMMLKMASEKIVRRVEKAIIVGSPCRLPYKDPRPHG